MEISGFKEPVHLICTLRVRILFDLLRVGIHKQLITIEMNPFLSAMFLIGWRRRGMKCYASCAFLSALGYLSCKAASALRPVDISRLACFQVKWYQTKLCGAPG